MSKRRVCLVAAYFLAVILAATEGAYAQADPQNFQFNSGQTIQPVFEGWAHNADGSFEMHFGYLNRNYVEELHVPIGAENRLTPDGPDRGQPTFFYPHVNHRMFSVTVPADWGERELVWQMTVRGETFRAIGWLQPEWEVFADPVAARFGEGAATNQPPTLIVDASRTLTLPATLTITATVGDDGLPEPRQRGGGGGRGTLPTFERDPDGPTLPINVPQIQRTARSGPTRTRVDRVSVTWTQWSGPTGVKVSSGAEQDGMATAIATFETPGDYMFRVAASDGRETVTEDIAVTVR